MKSFATLTTLFTAALAAPAIKQRQAAIPTVNFSLSNDFSGANAPGQVLADGNPFRLIDGFHGTPGLDRDGRIIATSLQSTTVVANVLCIVNDGAGNQVGLLNERSTFVDLDGQEGAVETDVSDFTIICEF